MRAGVTELPIRLDPQTQTTLDQGYKLNVRVAVTFTADGGSPTTKTIDIRLVKSPPSAAQIRKALLKVLIPSGKTALIAALLSNRGYRVQFRSPGAGRLTIGWSSVLQPSRLRRAKTRLVLLASASVTFSAPRAATVKIVLTKTGRSLLKSSKRLRLTAIATFTLRQGHPVTVSKGFTLKR